MKHLRHKTGPNETQPDAQDDDMQGKEKPEGQDDTKQAQPDTHKDAPK